MVFKAARSTYVIFTVFGGIPLAVWMVAFIVRPPEFPTLVKVFGLFLSYFCFAYFFISRYRFELNDGVLSYRSLFQGTKVLRLDEIEKARLAIGDYSAGERSKPFYRLELFANDTSKKPIVINLKMFKKEEVQQILECLRTKMVGNGAGPKNKQSDL